MNNKTSRVRNYKTLVRSSKSTKDVASATNDAVADPPSAQQQWPPTDRISLWTIIFGGSLMFVIMFSCFLVIHRETNRHLLELIHNINRSRSG